MRPSRFRDIAVRCVRRGRTAVTGGSDERGPLVKQSLAVLWSLLLVTSAVSIGVGGIGTAAASPSQTDADLGATPSESVEAGETSDSGPTTQNQVCSGYSGDVVVYVDGRDGRSLDDGRVVLYTESGPSSKEVSNGAVRFSDVSGGPRAFELYSDSDEFLGGEQFCHDGYSSLFFTADTAYVTSTDVTDKKEGDGDGVFEQGERLTISARVNNPDQIAKSVETTITIEGDSEDRGPLTLASGESKSFGRDFVPTRGGEYDVAITVRADYGPNGATTDTYETSFTVNSEPSSSIDEPSDSDPNIEAGEEIQFEVDASDTDGNLAGVDWYLDDDARGSDSLSGYADSASWQYTFSSPGTYVVEADVFDAARSFNDDPARWTVEVDPPTGTLDVTAVDENGNAVDDGRVRLYDSNYDELESDRTDAGGDASFPDLDTDRYIIELYGPNGDFWGVDTDVRVDDDGTRTTLQRNAPLLDRVTLTDETNGDSTYLVGETINIGAEVRNDGARRDVRVLIKIDTDNDGTVDETIRRGNRDTDIRSGEIGSYGYRYQPSTPGTKRVRVVTQAYLDGEWEPTDHSGWAKTFQVGSDEGDLTVTAIDPSGNPIENAAVVLYDNDPDGWNAQSETRTDSSGQAYWMGLDTGTYNLELYSPDGNYWGGVGDVEVDTSGTSVTIQRTAPRVSSVELTDQGNGEGAFLVDETVNIGPVVRNDGPDRRVKVDILVDTDNDGTAEETKTRGGDDGIVIPRGETQSYGYALEPESAGTKQVRVVTKAYVNGEWQPTDESEWRQFSIEQTAQGELVSFRISPDEVEPGDAVEATLTIKNTGDIENDFIVTLQGQNGIYVGTLIKKRVTIASGDQKQVRIEFGSENAASGTYKITANLWKGEEMTDRLGMETQNMNVVDVTASYLKTSPLQPINPPTRVYRESVTAGEIWDDDSGPPDNPGEIALSLEVERNQISPGEYIIRLSVNPGPALDGGQMVGLRGYDRSHIDVMYDGRDVTVDEDASKVDIEGRDSTLEFFTGVLTVGEAAGLPPSPILSAKEFVEEGVIAIAGIGAEQIDIGYNPSIDSSSSSDTKGIRDDFKYNGNEIREINEYTLELRVNVDREAEDPKVDVYTDLLGLTPGPGDFLTPVRYRRQITVDLPEPTYNQPPEFQDKAVYVWGYAGTLITNEDAADRFFERADEKGIETVYLSWGASQYVSASERAAFIEEAHENDMQVHALIGATGSSAVSESEQTIPEVLSYNQGRDDAQQFDGIHVDAEPAGADLQTFLGDYQTLLDGARTDIRSDGESINSQGLALSIAVGPWWADNAPTETRQLVEQESLDYIAVMTVRDSEQALRDRLATVVTGADVPYVVVAETKELPNNPEERTFYEEGEDATEAALEGISENPPSDGYLGSAYHQYQSSVSTWDALKGAETTESSLSAGETVTVNAEVLFDDNFPTSSHRSQVVVRFEGQDSSYTASKTITPPGKSQTTASVEWTVPSDAPSGEYQVTVSLLDTTLENGQYEAIASRSNPVKLDEADAGTVTVETEAPEISDFSATNPSGETVQIQFDSSESLSDITVELTKGGNPFATLTESDFTASQGTYTASYVGTADSTYAAVLRTAADSAGNDGASDQADTVTIEQETEPVPEPESPEASLSAPSEVTAGTTVTLDASDSADPDGPDDELEYEWSLSDKPDGVTVTLPDDASGDVTLQTAGTYEFTVTVTDEQDLTDTATVVVEVTEPPEQEQPEPVCDGCNAPQDLDGDGTYEDVNGNDVQGFGDVIALFENFQSDTVTENTELYDYNDNGVVGFGDIIYLFETI